MTNLEFIRKSEIKDLAEYIFERISDCYLHYYICGKYNNSDQCDFDCTACIKKWLYDEKRDEV